MSSNRPIKRINRFEQERGFVTRQGIKRIARARDVSLENQEFRQVAATKRTLSVENPADQILVCLQAKDQSLTTLDREVLYVGRALAGIDGQTSVIAIVFGELDSETDLTQMGADEVIMITDPALQQYVPDAQVDLLLELQEEFQVKHVLFPESDFGDSDLGRRYAVRSGKSIATSVFEVSETGLRRPCVNGRQQASSALTEVIMLQGGTTGTTELEFQTEAKAKDAPAAPGVGQQEEESFSLIASDIPLVEADFILSAGNGVRNMDTFHQLAEALDASIGGSRVIVDDGKLPRERQVGATGKIVNASIYIAIGISGAVQHLQGIKDCRYVIAVNTDESCDMIKRADLSIIADAEEWMQAMLGQLNQRKAGEQA